MKHLQKYFITGLLVIIPFWIILAFVRSLSSLVTNLFELNLFVAFFLSLVIITGLGIVVIQVFKRHLSRHINKARKGSNWWSILCRIISQFETLSSKAQDAFHHPILYKVDDGIYKLGFITDHDMDILGTYTQHPEHEALPQSDSVWVYSPYPVTLLGDLLLVEQRKIQLLSPQEAETIPLFIMTAGLLEKH